MPQVLARIGRFCEEYDATELAKPMQSALCESFGSGDGETFVVALVRTGGEDDGVSVVGHLFAAVETHLGARYGLVYQWEKDKGLRSNPELDRLCQEMLESWAHLMKLERIKALAAPSPSGREVRARLFTGLGWNKGSRIMTKELCNGR